MLATMPYDEVQQQALSEVLVATSEAISLGRGRAADRLERRREIRRRLSEITKAERTINDIKATIDKLNAELDTIAGRYGDAAKPIQLQLNYGDVPAEQRIQLQLELDAITAEMKKTAAETNEKIAAGKKQLTKLADSTLAKAPLESALFNSGSPELLREYRVLQNTERWANERVRAAKKELEKVQATIDFGKGSGGFADTGWGRITDRATEAAEPRMSAGTLAELSDSEQLARLELLTAESILTDAQREVRELYRIIISE